MSENVRLMVIGAHPDDCEQASAALALKVMKKEGNAVKFMSVSNGDRGHMTIGGGALAKIREAEARASGALGGFEYEILDIDDCEVTADLKTRELITKKIREFAPDIIVTHRPNDYHPDHRNTSLLIQDSAYLLSVPFFCPLSPVMKKEPVIMYMSDGFQKPYPFTPDIIIDSEEFIDRKIHMVASHKSQFFEWLPWIGGYENEVPTDENKRIEWLGERIKAYDRMIAGKYASLTKTLYGAKKITLAEAFEISEYGARPDVKALLARLG